MKPIYTNSRLVLLASLAALCVSGVASAKPQHGHDAGYQDQLDEPGYGPGAHGKHGEHGRHGADKGHGPDEHSPAMYYYEGWGGVSRDHVVRYAREERLGGYKPLPPGIQRNLRRGHPLPPGLAMRDVPPPLLRHLPPPRPGYQWRVAGSDLVLVAVSSAIVADILVNVLQ